jgi:hypothetical protein
MGLRLVRCRNVDTFTTMFAFFTSLRWVSIAKVFWVHYRRLARSPEIF